MISFISSAASWQSQLSCDCQMQHLTTFRMSAAIYLLSLNKFTITFTLQSLVKRVPGRTRTYTIKDILSRSWILKKSTILAWWKVFGPGLWHQTRGVWVPRAAPLTSARSARVKHALARHQRAPRGTCGYLLFMSYKHLVSGSTVKVS